MALSDSPARPLSLAEEVVLLMLDDKSGQFHELPPGGLGVALAGAILMDLALAGRIDSDLQVLYAVSAEPTGNGMLDDALAEITIAADTGSDWGTSVWVGELARRGDEFRDRLLGDLVARGILRVEDTRVLWVFGSRAYPPATGIEGAEVRLRLRTVLSNDDIPDPRDTLLIGLANATGILAFVLGPQELDDARARIDQLTTLEEISRSVTRAVYEVQMALMGGFRVS